MKPGVARLAMEHLDRLARFGTWIIGHPLAVVTSFVGGLHGRPSARARGLRDAVAAETRAGQDSA